MFDVVAVVDCICVVLMCCCVAALLLCDCVVVWFELRLSDCVIVWLFHRMFMILNTTNKITIGQVGWLVIEERALRPPTLPALLLLLLHVLVWI